MTFHRHAHALTSAFALLAALAACGDKDAEKKAAGMELLQSFRASNVQLAFVADAAEWQGWRFEVVDMDGKRVDKVLATRLAE